MTSTATEWTRRGFMTGVGAIIAARALTGRAAASISFSLATIFSIAAGAVRRPDRYTYDAVDFRADASDAVSGVLEFADSGADLGDDTAVFEFSDERPPPAGQSTGPQIKLPMSANIYDMQAGTSVLLIGLFATLGGAGVALKNYASLITMALAVILLVLSGLFRFSLVPFWLTLVMAVILLIVGLIVRWSR